MHLILLIDVFLFVNNEKLFLFNLALPICFEVKWFRFLVLLRNRLPLMAAIVTYNLCHNDWFPNI